MSAGTRASLDELIDAIESSYEFMLAYAAQGRATEPRDPEPTIRTTLTTLDTALAGLCDRVQACASATATAQAAVEEFLAVARRDVTAARAAVRLALAVPSIGSQLIDNLNASIHLRALLTDVFLIDEALQSPDRHA
ncbi:MAG: hypothetical protein IT480_13110 [Gammaproteobacteria bacterium]|nr:hypothetical protein [Gammaproteobacteria bacterium]